MKPDKHKQKRSEQYNKKHGATKSDKHSDTTGPKGKESKGQIKRTSSPKGGATSTSAASKNVQQTSPPSSDEEVQVAMDSGRKQFRRREIVSNWKRYEGEDQGSDTTSVKGVSFTSLLEAAGGSFSHLRLADEKDWEEEVMVSDRDLQNFLSVEPSSLSAALDCVPLHQRLGIQPAMFSEEMIEQFKSEAQMNKELYQKRNKESLEQHQLKQKTDTGISQVQSPATEPPPSTPETTEPGSSSHLTNNELSATVQDNKDSPILTEPAHDELDLEDILREDTKPKNGIEKQKVKGEEMDNLLLESKPVGVDLDLDDILCTSGPKQHSTDSNITIEQKGSPDKVISQNGTKLKEQLAHKGPATISLEDELDSLLYLDKEPSQSCGESGQATVKGVGEKKSLPDPNLESWLDSMLDD